MIQRVYTDLTPYVHPNKVLILYGPRRVGKTVLLTNFLAQCPLRYKFVTGDDLSIQEVFRFQRLEPLKQFIEGYELLVIDEAQNIENIGIGLKMLVDHIPGIHIIATGSASFELANKIGEPLTGRQTTLRLYPIAQMELLHTNNRHELQQKQEDYLLYGSYPEVLTIPTREKKKQYLIELMNGYLLKDILALEQVKGSKILLDLLRLLAFQVGSEVSYNELARTLAIDVKTVRRYLDLLEKAFVILPLQGFSRNLRSEIKEKSKYYFYDTGLRNAIIANFNPLSIRNDVGALWENFIFIERIKKQAYQSIYAHNYFWRTWEQKEIDFLEEREGKLFAYEFKYQTRPVRIPKSFLEAYPNTMFTTITPENYLDFIL